MAQKKANTQIENQVDEVFEKAENISDKVMDEASVEETVSDEPQPETEQKTEETVSDEPQPETEQKTEETVSDEPQPETEQKTEETVSDEPQPETEQKTEETVSVEPQPETEQKTEETVSVEPQPETEQKTEDPKSEDPLYDKIASLLEENGRYTHIECGKYLTDGINPKSIHNFYMEFKDWGETSTSKDLELLELLRQYCERE